VLVGANNDARKQTFQGLFSLRGVIREGGRERVAEGKGRVITPTRASEKKTLTNWRKRNSKIREALVQKKTPGWKLANGPGSLLKLGEKKFFGAPEEG